MLDGLQISPVPEEHSPLVPDYGREQCKLLQGDCLDINSPTRSNSPCDVRAYTHLLTHARRIYTDVYMDHRTHIQTHGLTCTLHHTQVENFMSNYADQEEFPVRVRVSACLCDMINFLRTVMCYQFTPRSRQHQHAVASVACSAKSL